MRRQRFFSASIQTVFLGVALIAGCNFYYEKPDSLGLHPGNLTDWSKVSPGWDLVNQTIFEPKCVECHSEYRSLDVVRAALEDIRQRAIVERNMPKAGPLPESEIALLDRWIAAGAPEFPPVVSASPTPSASPSTEPSAEPSTEPSPSPSPIVLEPVLPTYASIHDRILVPRCIRCHSPGGNAKKLPLVTKEDLLDSPTELVVPGIPEESGIMISITRTDDKRMPPPRRGPPLKPEEIEAIRVWIERGAKD